ncbi:MAG: hypothetical protein ABEK59_06500 [Halobacteria archaeon]
MDKELIRKSLDERVQDEFEERVEVQAEHLRQEMKDGHLDSDDYVIGLELEVYGVDGDYRLTDLPDDIYDGSITKELGIHNAEINTSPELLSEDGLETKKHQIREALDYIQNDFDEVQLVLDSFWTIPPGQGSYEYFSEVYDMGDLSLAANMRDLPRYASMDNYIRELNDQYDLTLPGFNGEFPSLIFESLATSMQPHLQIPDTDQFHIYFNTAVRTMGPVLALTTNSPFLPYDMYPEPLDFEDLDRTYHEIRIPVFDQAMNAYRHYDKKKLRFPKDMEHASDFLDRVVEDISYSPFLREWLEEELELNEEELQLDDGVDVEDLGGVADYVSTFWEFDHKRTTYWRWVRPVIGVHPEEPEESDKRGSIRIEYRPIPTQPGLEDVVSAQALTSGLLIGLVENDHPLHEMGWSEAKMSFYNAVEDGIDAHLFWLDEDGNETTDEEVIFEEVFRYARKGLESLGIDREYAEKILEPVEERWREKMTPSKWKIGRVRKHMTEGESFEDAVIEMQEEYIDLQAENDSFADWI